MDFARMASATSGLLHSGQIKYIVRTAIKNVGGKRILLLYIYLREHLEKGVYTPHWTMFQGKEDFITLATREDGNLSWRVSNFDNLEYGIEKKLAFYTLTDKERVVRYCGGNQDALVEMDRLKCRIKAKKELVRRHKKQRPSNRAASGVISQTGVRLRSCSESAGMS